MTLIEQILIAQKNLQEFLKAQEAIRKILEEYSKNRR